MVPHGPEIVCNVSFDDWAHLNYMMIRPTDSTSLLILKKNEIRVLCNFILYKSIHILYRH